MKIARNGLLALLVSVAGLLPGLYAEEPDSVIVPFKRFGLEWKTEMPGKIVLLRIWYSMDAGATWKMYSEAENPSSPAPVKVSEDGVYGFFTQAKAISGLEETAPVPGTKPKIVVTVDTKKPSLVLIKPNTAEVLNPTQEMRIEWNAVDVNFSATPISLYHSVDGGGSWAPIKKDIPNTGSYIWKLPAESTQMARVKIIAVDRAGNAMEAVSDTNFTVDGKAPVSRVTGPTEAKAPRFDVTYNCQDVGGAGVAKVELYYQLGDNKKWHLFGVDEDLASPIHFEAKVGGRYGFKIVATDRVGNSEKVPDEGTPPDVVCLMDSVPPMVAMLNFKGEILPAGGGLNREIQWKATDENMAENPITIEFSKDDGATWSTVVTLFKNAGSYPWVVPNGIDVNSARLRVSAIDVLGNKGADTSDAFQVVSTAPKTFVKIVQWKEDVDAQAENERKMTPKAPVPTPAATKTAADHIQAATNDLKNNNLWSAEDNARRAIQIDANNAEAHYVLGRVLFQKKALKEAAAAYEKSIQLNGNYQDSRTGLGATYVLLGNQQVEKDQEAAKTCYTKAVAEYEEAVRITPDTWDEHFNLGYVQARLGNQDKAVASFKKALALDANETQKGDTYWYLGQVENKRGNLQQALDAYREAAKIYPKNSQYQQKADFKARELEDLIKKK